MRYGIAFLAGAAVGILAYREERNHRRYRTAQHEVDAMLERNRRELMERIQSEEFVPGGITSAPPDARYEIWDFNRAGSVVA